MSAAAPHTSSFRDDNQRFKSLVMTLALAMFALALGIWGFSISMPPLSWLERAYRSLQLFSMNSGSSDVGVPWQLEAARWLAPSSLVIGAEGLAGQQVRQWWRQAAAAQRQGHSIVIGLGKKGLAFAHALGRIQGAQVTGIDSDPTIADNAKLEMGSLGKFLAIQADATQRRTLDLAAAHRAAEIVLATDSDQVNVGIAESLLERFARDASPRLQTLRIHISDPCLRDELTEFGMFAGGLAGPRVHLFNHYAALARRILFEHPLESIHGISAANNRDAEIHLVTAGLDDLQLAIIAETARVGHYRHGRKVHVHILLGFRDAQGGRLLRTYPQIGDCLATLHFMECEDPRAFARPMLECAKNSHPHSTFTLIAPLDVHMDVHRETLRLRRDWDTRRPMRVLVPKDIEPGSTLRQVHEAGDGKKLPGDVVFYAMRATLQDCAIDGIDGRDDGIARLIHERWLEENQRLIADAESKGLLERARELSAKPAFKPWDELPPDLQDSNRAQSSHSFVKLRAAGLDPTDPALDRATWEAVLGDTALLEDLARMEHQRWWADKRLAGYRGADSRNDPRRAHDQFKPYEALDEANREFDREAVRKVGHYLHLLPRRRAANRT